MRKQMLNQYYYSVRYDNISSLCNGYFYGTSLGSVHRAIRRRVNLMYGYNASISIFVN